MRLSKKYRTNFSRRKRFLNRRLLIYIRVAPERMLRTAGLTVTKLIKKTDDF